MFTAEGILGTLIFGSIGFVAFVYGKKTTKIPPLVLGLLLMSYPYFVSSIWLIYGIGTALTAGLYFWRED